MVDLQSDQEQDRQEARRQDCEHEHLLAANLLVVARLDHGLDLAAVKFVCDAIFDDVI